jgi:hypothetical protein
MRQNHKSDYNSRRGTSGHPAIHSAVGEASLAFSFSKDPISFSNDINDVRPLSFHPVRQTTGRPQGFPTAASSTQPRQTHVSKNKKRLTKMIQFRHPASRKQRIVKARFPDQLLRIRNAGCPIRFHWLRPKQPAKYDSNQNAVETKTEPNHENQSLDQAQGPALGGSTARVPSGQRRRAGLAAAGVIQRQHPDAGTRLSGGFEVELAELHDLLGKAS